MKTLAGRNSSVELLKVLAITLIVISHVAQTLSANGYDIWNATGDMQNLSVSMMRYLGSIGNDIFFVCSAWFLLESRLVNWKKFLQLALDVWAVSVLICVVVYVLNNREIENIIYFRQIFPISFTNNWYITCYLLFYAIHPILNKVINSLNQSQLLGISLSVIILFWIDCFCCLFGSSFILFNAFLQWVGIYFITAYFRRYCQGLCGNKRFGICLSLSGFLGTFGSVAILNWGGGHIGFLSGKLQIWNLMDNPFILMMTFGLVLLAVNHKWSNKAVNYFSSLSLLVYIFHENYLIRTYYRTSLLGILCDKYGYDHIVLLVLLTSFAILISSLMVSAIYKVTIQHLTKKLNGRMFPLLKSIWNKIEAEMVQ